MRGRVEHALALADLMPTREDRARVIDVILSNAPAARTEAEAVERIGRLPSAYDRTLAYCAQAERALLESKRGR